MKNTSIALTVTALAVLRAHATAAPDHCKLSMSDSVVTFSAPDRKQRQVTVTLTNPPTTRARITFQRSTAQHALEWDPALDPRLAQTFIAELGDAPWNVSIAIDSTILKQTNVATTVFAGDLTATGATITETFHVSTTSDGSTTDSAKTRLDAWPKPTFTITCTDLPLIDITGYAPTASGGTGTRGFGTVSEPISQTLALLGEIALERAKAGALQILRGREWATRSSFENLRGSKPRKQPSYPFAGP